MGCTLVFDPVSYLLFITVFEFAITFWVWLVNSFQKVSLFPDYILDDTLDNDTPNGDNDINDNDDENYINDYNWNNLAHLKQKSENRNWQTVDGDNVKLM